MESIVEGYREDTSKDERENLHPMAGAAVMANAKRCLFEAGMAGVNLADAQPNPVWGSPDFVINGCVRFAVFEGDPNRYGLARGLWWKPIGELGPSVERVTNQATLAKLDEWLAKQLQIPAAVGGGGRMNNAFREKQKDARQQQLNGAGQQPRIGSPDPLDEFPDAFAILMRRAQSATSNANEDEAFAAKLEKQAHELRGKAAASYLHARALRDAASKLAPATGTPR